MTGFGKPAWTLGILAILSLWPAPAAGQDGAGAGLSEIRGGIFYHDAAIFVAPGEREEHRVERTGADVNLELLFVSPGFLAPVRSPRPHVGVTVSPGGATSQAYAGLTWSWNLSDRVFFEFAGGGAVHDGQTGDPSPDPSRPISTADGEKIMGCRVLFRGAVALGLRFGERQSVILALDHISNGYLCDPNPGLDTLGLRWGYRF